MGKAFPQIGHRSRAGMADGYPFDLDASLRFTRPKTGLDVFPIQWNGTNFAQLGCVSGILQQFDGIVWGQGYGAPGFGPIRSALPVNLQWQMMVPGLVKVGS